VHYPRTRRARGHVAGCRQQGRAHQKKKNQMERRNCKQLSKQATGVAGGGGLESGTPSPNPESVPGPELCKQAAAGPLQNDGRRSFFRPHGDTHTHAGAGGGLGCLLHVVSARCVLVPSFHVFCRPVCSVCSVLDHLSPPVGCTCAHVSWHSNRSATPGTMEVAPVGSCARHLRAWVVTRWRINNINTINTPPRKPCRAHSHRRVPTHMA